MTSTDTGGDDTSADPLTRQPEPARVTRVLLVDDQALIRTGLRLILDDQPDLNVVGEAADGRVAVDMVRALRPDVVLMDIRMPECDGIAATATVTAEHDDVAVLILTTYDLDEYVFEGLRAGASGFLLKDAPPEELLAAVRAIADGDAVFAPRATRQLIDRFVPLLPRSQERDDALATLTGREAEVFDLVVAGLSNREIAEQARLAESTVKVHVGRILAKLGLRDRVQAVIFAYESGLVPPRS